MSRQHALTVKKPIAVMLALLLALGGGLASALVAPTPAQAAAKVTVSGTPDPDKETKLKVSGTGFQSVKNGFGGIYVLFGAKLSDNWQPSKGGKTGQDYRYQYDDEEKPAGYQLFVSFPGSSTESAANGGTIHPDGTWSATLRVSGTKFKSYDRENNEVDVDCTKTGCGVMTVGAHGVVNPNNESYTPVQFEQAAGAAAANGSDAKDTTADDGKKDGKKSTGTTSGNGGNAGNGGTGSGPVIAAPAQPIIDSNGVNQINASMSKLMFGIIVALIIGTCLVALAAGVGAYMAAQSLLLGVNPEALERVRARRAKRAIAAQEKQKRKVAAYQAKQESRTRAAEQRMAAEASRADMKADYVAAEAAERSAVRDAGRGTGYGGGSGPAGGPGAGAGAEDSAAAYGPMSFFAGVRAEEGARTGQATDDGAEAGTRVLATIPSSPAEDDPYATGTLPKTNEDPNYPEEGRH